MTSRDAWLKVFPLDEAARAVGFLRHAWNELAASNLSGFHAGAKEPDLTFVLAERLKDTAQTSARLTGRWGQESLGGIVDKRTGRIARRWRTDIEYFSNRCEPRLSLIFEFKKLDELERTRTLYYSEGMSRFVTGDYGKGEPVALMVGIFTADATACERSIREGLTQAVTVAELKMVRSKGGGLLCIPSRLFAPHAAFDTEHQRTAKKAAPHGTICISHLFLAFPLNTRKRQRGRLTRKRPEGNRE
ncbi:hypothetical protein HNQ60_003919 [Povalibacter uvarum]|uniref:Fis family transcriptional regulator n=1 Tax=Povalibacter uvarum TaxID=732238 RepID=A0A841HSR0_9GAMM|nr:hypothetical protein [Povalibacter uvarum]